MKHFFAVFITRNREFLRDRATLAWNILMPVCIVIGLTFTFTEDNPNLYKVGLLGTPNSTLNPNFFATDYIQFIPLDNPEHAMIKVERHQLDMLVDLGQGRYWINDSSPKGYILERVLWGTSDVKLNKQAVSGPAIRYVDWLVPGILAMNMMFSCLFGIGYVIVRYRKNGVLKRLKATPLTALEFLTAQVASRLWLILWITVAIFLGTDLYINFSMFGSYLSLLIIFILGAISLTSMGLVMAARTASEELAGGLLNLISWPMMFLSEVWFSLEGTHPWVQQLALIFPLTHLISGARAIMIDGAGLWDIGHHLLALMIMSVAFLALGAYSFRWE